MSYNELTSEIQNMSIDDKIGLKYLIEKYIIEDNRNKYYDEYLESVELANAGKLKFTSDINELKKMLDE